MLGDLVYTNVANLAWIDQRFVGVVNTAYLLCIKMVGIAANKSINIFNFSINLTAAYTRFLNFSHAEFHSSLRW